MYAEELKQKPIGPLVGALITIGIVAGLYVCGLVISFLQFWLGIVWPQFVLYAAIIVLVFLAIRKHFTEYIYLIERDRITFGRRVGKREKELLYVPLREVRSIKPYDEKVFKELSQEKKKFKFTFKDKATWSVIDCAGCVILLSCSQEYETCLKKRIHRG